MIPPTPDVNLQLYALSEGERVAAVFGDDVVLTGRVNVRADGDYVVELIGRFVHRRGPQFDLTVKTPREARPAQGDLTEPRSCGPSACVP